MNCLHRLALVAMLLTATGCWGGSSAQNAANNAQPAADGSKAADAKREAVDSTDDGSASVKDDANASTDDSVTSEATQAETESAEDEQAAGFPAQRFVILTSGGPLLLDLRITLDGRPPGAAFDELLDQVLAAADTNGDGRATWEEFTANREFLEGPIGDLDEDDQRTPRTWIDQYDVDADGRMRRGEAADWLGRDSGRSARALDVRSARSGSADPRWNSRIWGLLDADASGELSAAEISAVERVLRARDEDDNQIITQSELAAVLDQLAAGNPMMARPQSTSSRRAALRLTDEPDVDRLDYLLTNLYAPRQTLAPDSFPAFPGMFAQLDGDQDEWLSGDELASLADIEPHLALDVQFAVAGEDADAASDEVSSSPTISVSGCSPELQQVAQNDGRLVVAAGGTRLVIIARDFAPVASEQQTALRSQLSLMVHDQYDAMFEALDANSDGRLGDRELATAAKRLLGGDANDDGALAPGELPTSMIIALSRAEPSGMERFYVPRATDLAAAGEAPAWFVHADFNGDGDVSRREFLGDDEQFAKLDANGDGFVDAAEAAKCEGE